MDIESSNPVNFSGGLAKLLGSDEYVELYAPIRKLYFFHKLINAYFTTKYIYHK
jgi:hypothetical protein